MKNYYAFFIKIILCLAVIFLSAGLYADDVVAEDSITEDVVADESNTEDSNAEESITEKNDADDSIISGSISLSAGLKRGTIHEYVFSSNYKISQLDWQLYNCYYAGISADCLILGRVYLSANMSKGMNEDVGRIEDYDWVDSSDNITPYITNYSNHTNILDEAYFFDSAAGFRFMPGSQLGIVPLAGINYTWVKMTAYDGYYCYPGYRGIFIGQVMTYRQEYILPKVGLMLQYEFNDFDFETWGFMGFWGKCNDLDNHYLRSLDFYGTMKNVESYEWGISAAYPVLEWLQLKLYTSVIYVPTTRGSLYSKNVRTGARSATSKYGEGIGMTLWDLGISAGYRF